MSVFQIRCQKWIKMKKTSRHENEKISIKNVLFSRSLNLWFAKTSKSKYGTVLCNFYFLKHWTWKLNIRCLWKISSFSKPNFKINQKLSFISKFIADNKIFTLMIFFWWQELAKRKSQICISQNITEFLIHNKHITTVKIIALTNFCKIRTSGIKNFLCRPHFEIAIILDLQNFTVPDIIFSIWNYFFILKFSFKLKTWI